LSVNSNITGTPTLIPDNKTMKKTLPLILSASVTSVLLGMNPGDTDCSSAIGPDVIVGDLYDVADYGSVGDIAAFAVGTYSCNIGDETLSWISSNNQHPTIAQSMYRVSDQRIEQIGQSWLKHGFFALQNDLCCPSCNAATSTELGVGCSDPYSAGLNGSQSGLGPKFEVNPFTGDFVFPATDLNETGNAIYKRLQVHHSDLEASGEFIVEGHYIASDDAAAGNLYNNASWRPVNISGGGSNWGISLAGQTQREDPAIRAWKYYDSSVELVDHYLQQDGLVILALKTINNGNGTWTYEYAIQNHCSERAIRTFVIPITPGATVTNIDFRDVDYHSGEPFDGTDWSSTVSSDSIQWSTQTYSANPDANALRWGTLYNFSFTCTASPASGSGLIGLFKPGNGPDVESISITTPGGGDGYIDCNGNNVADADDIANGTSIDCNENSVPDECEQIEDAQLDLVQVASGITSPSSLTSPPGNASLLYVSQLGGTVTYIDTDSGTTGSFLDISDQASSGGERGLFSIVFDSDYGSSNNYFYVSYTDNNGDSVISRFTASSSTFANPNTETVMLQVTQDFSNHNGGGLAFGPDGMLYASFGDGGSAGDPNNRAQNPQSLLGKLVRLDPDNGPSYIPSDNPFVGNSSVRDEIWALGLRNPYRINFDRLTGDLWIGDVGQNATEEIDFQPASSNGGENYGWRCYEGDGTYNTSGCSSSSNYDFPIYTYPLTSSTCSVIGGFIYRGCAMPNLSGTYFFSDYCAGWIKSIRYDGSSVTEELDRSSELGWTSSLGAILSFGEDSDGEIYILSSNGTVSKIIPQNTDPVCGNGIVESGEDCDDGNNETGDGCFECTFESGADLCENAYVAVVGDNGFDTRGAGSEYSDPSDNLCSGTYLDWDNSPDVWFKFTPGFSGSMTLSTCDSSSYDTSMALYVGDSCGDWTYIACNGDASGQSGCQSYYSRIANYSVDAGETYWIRLGGYNGATGAGTLELSYTPRGTDCNSNGLDDSLDISNGSSSDCNNNNVPDECDIAAGISEDCDGGPIGSRKTGSDMIASFCSGCHGSTGSGGSGLPGPSLRNKTRVELTIKLYSPTDHPGGAFNEFTQVDFANLEAFLGDAGSYGRPDGVPDECGVQPDCNNNGTSDGCELEAATQIDLDWNGVPDDCESKPCPSDTNNDGIVDGTDLATILGFWGSNDPVADINGDGLVDGTDLATLLGGWGFCP
jgi:cysteine-rich repeat protein